MKRDTVSAYRARAKKTHDEIDAELARQKSERDARYKAARAAEKQAESERQRLTREDILGSRAIRTDTGWRVVVKVNTKTVSVRSGYSWNDLIPIEKVLEVKR